MQKPCENTFFFFFSGEERSGQHSFFNGDIGRVVIFFPFFFFLPNLTTIITALLE